LREIGNKKPNQSPPISQELKFSHIKNEVYAMTVYEQDFYSWTQQQAELLKNRLFAEIDIDNLIEEIESMGRSEKRELESRLTILLLHLLKWRYQPDYQGRSWALSIDEQRMQFLKVLDENPSLKSQIERILTSAYKLAVVKAAKETRLNKNVFPEVCPWSLSELSDEDFYPKNEELN
jgi:hypothetical protein